MEGEQMGQYLLTTKIKDKNLEPLRWRKSNSGKFPSFASRTEIILGIHSDLVEIDSRQEL